MVALLDLWLPILLAAVLVFVVSSIIHMVIPVHRSDCRRLPGEAALMEAMRAEGVEPGHYVLPYAGSMQELGSPEHIEKQKQGPVGFLTIMPNGPPALGKSLALWFAFSVVVGVFTGYIGTLGLAPGAESMDVFRVTGTAAILGYAVSHVPESIWKGLSWGITLKYVVDGVVYGLVTAAAFAWLWPAAPAAIQ